jgi:uncharacterized BrkB/YihY/UPF0761 family membrane protein
MSSTESRGTPLVEVVVKRPEKGPSGTGRLRRSFLLGFMGAVLLIVVASLGGGVFLPWFSTSAEGVPKTCEPHIEAAVTEAVGNLTTSQAGAGAVGFLVFAAVGLLWKPAARDEDA